ncbi:TrkA family potassium uptake protein [Parvimonas micra]|uniref:potassium channel family protein n=1 Tax=Parvimonas TaxID=543311 RepID=UPI00020DCCAF|nr:TrkA family potassium uptake protein [Parvimonas sp.]EGL35654.1 TrkA N-terminal domain protein [Parvimonas sp. oral taxon 110 str. F0139]MBF1294713.1 TrkA family potassium uptake protein [Parvimonas sp.]MBF1300456.1 TrkA family potassium uptake protein [Parvimonas sp.]
MKQIAVIGCGRFGMSLAITLGKLGNEVMVIDKDEEIINSIADKVTHAIICDVSVDGSLKELGLANFDICVVAIGSDYKTSIIATVEAKELGIPKIIAKATDSVQAMVLRKIGADRVIIPEKDMGVRVANNISNSNILDSINLSDEYSLVEISPMEVWVGKSIKDSEIRNRHHVNIVAIKNKDGLEINVGADYVIKSSDILLVAGRNDWIGKLV